MANLKSSQKDIRRIKRRTERNRAAKSRLKTLRKQVESAVESKDADSIKKATTTFVSQLDKVAKTRVIHPNKANRLKSRLSAKTKKVLSAVPQA